MMGNLLEFISFFVVVVWLWLLVPRYFHFIPSACSSNLEGTDLGLITGQVLLSMELSGNLIQ